MTDQQFQQLMEALWAIQRQAERQADFTRDLVAEVTAMRDPGADLSGLYSR